MTLTTWWLTYKPIPPFDVTVCLDKGDKLQVTVSGLRIYQDSVWFLDSFNNEYFNGENIQVVRVPYYPPTQNVANG